MEQCAIHKRTFANRAVTRTFRVKLHQINTVFWTPEKTRHGYIDGGDCAEAKKELALRAEAHGLAIEFLSAPSYRFGLRLYTQRGGKMLDAPLAHRYPEESMHMFQAAHAAIDAACKEDQISPLMQRPWHELARAQNLRVVNARDNNELHVGLLLLEDHVRQPSNEWILIGFDMEGNDKGDHGMDHLYQIAFETVVILVRPTDFVRVRRVLNKANVLVAAFDAADATQLRGLLPRARVVDVQLAAAQAGAVPTRFALDRTYNKLCPDEAFLYLKGDARQKRAMHFTARGMITWAARSALSRRRVAYAASDAFAHLACMRRLLQMQTDRQAEGKLAIPCLPR